MDFRYYGVAMPVPSVLLHDHLDGGLRPTTVLELAEASGYSELPSTDLNDLASWFDQSQSGSLENYLKAFDHTIGVMQTAEAIERVAYEASQDLSADGVVYAELRFCPPLHTARGLRPIQVIEAVASGLRMGEETTGMAWGLIIDSLRHLHDAEKMVRLALSARNLGVVGFDIAGPEAGYPPADHVAGFRLAREQGLRITIHAGESAGANGVAYIASSMDVCGSERLGHGVQLIEDCIVKDGEIAHIGPVAERVRSRRIALEMCPASNLATGNLTPESHPVGLLHRAGFNVTLSTDNRLMSNTSMTKEFAFVQQHHGFDNDDLVNVTKRSLDAAFCSWDTKAHLWEDVIAPGYARNGAAVESEWV